MERLHRGGVVLASQEDAAGIVIARLREVLTRRRVSDPLGYSL